VDPLATVLILPSDHFVHPVGRFLEHIRRLVEMAEIFADRVVLLGVKADRPEVDYGWIEAGPIHDPVRRMLGKEGAPARTVKAFKEKPFPEDAQSYLRQGYLWNTMIMAVRVETLWKLGRQFLPDVVDSFEPFAETLRDGILGSPEFDVRTTNLLRTYHSLRPKNFSTGLLQCAPEHTLVTAMDDVLWDDWGRPSRIVESLSRIGRQPAFSQRDFAEEFGLCTA
jgi:mannose-1-phosphate guanylyltransferase